MNRITSGIPIGDGETRYRTRLTGDPAPFEEVDPRTGLFTFLRSVVDMPDLVSCGLNTPQKMTIYHNGAAWVIDAEAIAKDF